MEVSMAEKSNDVKALKSNKENLEVQLKGQQRIFEKFSYVRDTLINQFKEKKKHIDEVLNGKCPTCGIATDVDDKHKQ